MFVPCFLICSKTNSFPERNWEYESVNFIPDNSIDFTPTCEANEIAANPLFSFGNSPHNKTGTSDLISLWENQ